MNSVLWILCVPLCLKISVLIFLLCTTLCCEVLCYWTHPSNFLPRTIYFESYKRIHKNSFTLIDQRSTAVHKGEISKPFLWNWCQEIFCTILCRARTPCFSWFQNKTVFFRECHEIWGCRALTTQMKCTHTPLQWPKNNVTIVTGLSGGNIPDPNSVFHHFSWWLVRVL